MGLQNFSVVFPILTTHVFKVEISICGEVITTFLETFSMPPFSFDDFSSYMLTKRSGPLVGLVLKPWCRVFNPAIFLETKQTPYQHLHRLA